MLGVYIVSTIKIYVMKISFNELIEEYLTNADISEESRKSYRVCLNMFTKWVVFSGRDPWKMKRADILVYKSYLVKSERSEKTIGMYLRVVSQLYQFAENNGYYENIAAGIKIRDTIVGYRKGHLNEDQARTLLSSIKTDTLTGSRDFAIINLMVRTGLRCVEVSRLRVCDVEEVNGGYCLVVQRKGRVSRCERLGVSAKVVNPIREYICRRHATDDKTPLFLTSDRFGAPLTPLRIGRIVKDRLQGCGLYSKKITAHSLRHTAAVLAILNNATLKQVQIMLGHRNPETTELYLKSINDDLCIDNPAGKAIDYTL